MRRTVMFVTMLLMGMVTSAGAQLVESGQLPLWPGEAPGALGPEDGDRPTITPYLPEGSSSSRSAVVIFPGGGYGHLAVDHEGAQVARSGVATECLIINGHCRVPPQPSQKYLPGAHGPVPDDVRSYPHVRRLRTVRECLFARLETRPG